MEVYDQYPATNKQIERMGWFFKSLYLTIIKHFSRGNLASSGVNNFWIWLWNCVESHQNKVWLMSRSCLKGNHLQFKLHWFLHVQKSHVTFDVFTLNYLKINADKYTASARCTHMNLDSTVSLSLQAGVIWQAENLRIESITCSEWTTTGCKARDLHWSPVHGAQMFTSLHWTHCTMVNIWHPPTTKWLQLLMPSMMKHYTV